MTQSKPIRHLTINVIGQWKVHSCFRRYRSKPPKFYSEVSLPPFKSPQLRNTNSLFANILWITFTRSSNIAQQQFFDLKVQWYTSSTKHLDLDQTSLWIWHRCSAKLSRISCLHISQNSRFGNGSKHLDSVRSNFGIQRASGREAWMSARNIQKSYTHACRMWLWCLLHLTSEFSEISPKSLAFSLKISLHTQFKTPSSVIHFTGIPTAAR